MGDVQLVTTTRISKTSLSLGRGSPSSDPPAFTLPPRNARVSLGGTARLDGKVRGSPEPQVCWYRNGQAVVAGDRFSMEQSSRGTFSLVVQSVQEDDAGRYTCEAVNDAGSRQVTVEIIVEGNAGKKYGLPTNTRQTGGRFGVPAVESRPSIWGESPPKFVTKPSRLFLRVGQSGKFSAKITGRPQPQVVWLKGDEELQASGRHSVFERSGIHFLEIRDACAEDAGTYTCSVSNSAGKAMASAELNIQGSETESSTTRGTPEVSPVPKTVDAQSGSHTSNGLPSDQQSSRPKSEVPETFQSSGPVGRDTKEGTETRTEGWRSTVTSPKPTHTEKSREEGTRRVESRLKASTASPAPGSSSSPSPSPSSISSSSSIQSMKPQAPAGVEADTQAPRGPGRLSRGAGELSSPGRASGASSLLEPSRDVLWPGRDTRARSPVGAAPRFELLPQSQDALESTKVVFKCQVSGSPMPTVSWQKDGLPARSRGGLSLHQDGDVHLLCVERAQRSDAGQYGCTATNSRGKVSATWTLNVKSPRPEGKAPVFSSLMKGCSVTAGQDFTLQCSVEGRPVPIVTWLLDDKPCQHAQAVCEKGLAQLTVQGALPDAAGSYSCVAENEHGRAECSAIVVVKEKPSIKRTTAAPAVDSSRPTAPVFLRGLKDLKVMDGSQVTMTVEVAGNPPPEVVWLHNGKEIQESEDFHFERKGNEYTLFIQEVFPEDTGKYTCEVWNQVGEARSEASLTVQEPQDGVQPWFITKPKSASACLGQHVLLSCAIAGDPFPEYTWMKDGQEVSAGAEFDILQKEDVVSLLIRKVKRRHAGDYEICLKNKVGDCSCVATLQITEGSFTAESQREEGGGTVGGVDRTLQARGGGASEGHSSRSGGSNRFHQPQWKQQQQQPQQQQDPEQEQEDPEEEEEQEEGSGGGGGGTQGLLKRRVETREHREDQIRQQEPQQLDFRTVLGRKVTTKSVSEEDLKEITAEQMDFRGNLKGQVQPKTLSEDERKGKAAQQVDFRSVLGKKGAPPAPPKPLGKKPTTGAEKNGDCPSELNCVDGDEGIMAKAPVFTKKLGDMTVLDGQRLRLECQVSSAPAASITWTLEGKPIKPSKFIVLANEGGRCSLTISKVLPEDQGRYTCQAENAGGKSECSCAVRVDDSANKNASPADKNTKKPSAPTTENEARIKKPPSKTASKQGPPTVLEFPDDMKVLAGQPVDILCKFVGAQPITCNWLKFRKPIQLGKTDLVIETTETTSRLYIPASQDEDCGCYTVEVRNNYGMRQAALNLTIVDKPDPPARVPTISEVGKTTLTLQWRGPSYDGGSAVQSYNLEIWDSITKKWKDLASCTNTYYYVQNLTADREYKFRVRAINIYGTGEPSAESVAVTVGVEEEPEEEPEVSDEENEKVPEYKTVSIKNDVNVKDFYNVEDRLGAGKFGTVFKLIEKSTKKVWAGKFIKAYSEKEKKEVREEIGIMNDLHHPKLVQLVDAFECEANIVMVLEMISGGELFERIIDEDFELSEREVIKYMLQIVAGVNFIHKQGIVHLDLKPENIMCVNKTGSKIKLIDFGLARRLGNAGKVKVLFGTPEFVAPEVINYEPISYSTDMWSIGVICYILVSGLSPFMGDNDGETLANVTSATWDFEDEAFDDISDVAKDFITNLLKKDKNDRLSCDQCLEHPWLKQDTKTMEAKALSKERMKKYLLRRKWQKTGHALRAIGRLSNMAMMAGLHAKKGSPTEEDTQFLEAGEAEDRTPVKPSFGDVIKDVEVVEGSAARFECTIEGFPDPEVVWYKDEQPIKDSRHYQIDYDEDGNCSLVISDVCGDDDAKYTCKAVNSQGEATCTAELIVEVMGGGEEEEEEEEEE